MLRDKLLGAGNLKEEIITLKSGEKVLVKELSLDEQDRVREKSVKFSFDEDGKMKLDSMKTSIQIAATVIESTYDPETRKKLFTYADMTAMLSKSQNSWVSEISTAASKLNGESADVVDEIKKN